MLYMCVVQGRATIEDATQQLTESGILQPVLFRIDSRYFIKADHLALPVYDAACFADCVELLFMSYFVFHVEYPYDIRLVFALIERLLNVRSTVGKSSVLANFLASA